MDLRDQITKITSEQLNIPEEIVHKVNMFQYEYMKKQAHGDTITMEQAGLGTFTISKAKIKKRINKMNNFLNTYEKRLSKCHESEVGKINGLNKKIQDVKNQLQDLNDKYNKIIQEDNKGNLE